MNCIVEIMLRRFVSPTMTNGNELLGLRNYMSLINHAWPD